MPRFVVLWHETSAGSARPPHFDLMLEADGALWTWALAEWPPSGSVLVAHRLADHRLDYLDYEGQISGGRGFVRRVERGACSVLERAACRIVAAVSGEKLRGTLCLEQQAGSAEWTITLL